MILCHYCMRVRVVLWRWRLIILSAVLLCAVLLVYINSTHNNNAVTYSTAHPVISDHHNVPAAVVEVQYHQDIANFVTTNNDADYVEEDASSSDKHSLVSSLSTPESQVYIPPLRVVHLDLKGAPPSIDYLMWVMRLSSVLGATGLLIEWEDMLPFSGILQPISATNHYTREQVKSVLKEAARLHLEVIPLVQTFGHMEHVLKLRQFASLREDPRQPAAICPSRNESRQFIRLLIDQVMSLHPGVERVHIGCDEVFQLGTCRLCREKSPEILFTEHVRFVAEYVRERDSRVTALIWDDMMRQMSARELKQSGLGQLVQPVVWVYAEDVDRFVGHSVFNTLSQVFPTVWTASAFKGAFGETLSVPPLQRHLDNNINWLHAMNRESTSYSGTNFAGLILTGWQRYDHFSVLCELLPSAIPSLALSLATVSHGFFNDSLRSSVFSALKCDVPDQQPFLELSVDPLGHFPFTFCRFPGVDIFKMAVRSETVISRVLQFVREIEDKRGWLTEYSATHNYTSPFRVDELIEAADIHRMSLISLTATARSVLKRCFDHYTVSEWLEQKLAPPLRKLRKLEQRAKQLKSRTYWPRRPLILSSADDNDQVLLNLGVVSAEVSNDDYKSTRHQHQQTSDNYNSTLNI